MGEPPPKASTASGRKARRAATPSASLQLRPFTSSRRSLYLASGRSMFRLTAWPTIISVSFWGSVSAVFTVPMYLPFRSTATLSEMAMTSWSLWVMMTMALPSAFMARRMSKSRSVSWGVSTAVGSSRMRMSAPR